MESTPSTSTAELPPIDQRLNKLHPSRELLEFYRQKFSEYDQEYHELVEKVDKYDLASKQLEKSQWEIRQREDEIKQLQQALSDMQVYLFQEREHVLRLYAENDRLKIRELEGRKKIQQLLNIQGVSTKGETTYMIKEPPAKVLVQQHVQSSDMESKGDSRGPGGHKKSPKGIDSEDPSKENLILTVEALTSQLEEQTKLCKEQVDTLLEDRRIRADEAEAIATKDAEKICTLTEQVHNTQHLLYDSTKDYLQLKYENRAKEREWIAEKDILLRDLGKLKDELSAAKGDHDSLHFVHGDDEDDAYGSRKANIANIKQMQMQLQQTQQLADWYREQCINQDEQVSQLKEENEISKSLFKERSDKISKRLELMNNRYQALEKRRKLEVEGYKNDIKILRERLRDLEKQMYKLTSALHGDQDMDILSQVKKTARNSKRIMGDLQNLKAKVYSAETDFRTMHNH